MAKINIKMASVAKIWEVLSDRTFRRIIYVSYLPVKQESNSAPISSYSILSDHKEKRILATKKGVPV